MKERGIEINRQYLSEYERVPKEAVEHVIYNEGLIAFSPDPRIKKLSNPDSLLEVAGFFGVGRMKWSDDVIDAKKSGAVLRLQPPGYDRAVVLNFPKNGFEDEYGNRYAELSAKGTGVTQKREAFKVGEPLGLFGERHGVQDMFVSDNMAAHGGKVSRGLAVITLNHDYLRSLEGRQRVPYSISKQVDIVEKNGDRACIYVRLIGGGRDVKLNLESSDIFGAKQEVDSAARMIFQEEDDMGLEAYLDRYLFTDDRKSLLNLAFGLHEDNLAKSEALKKIARHFFHFNCGVFSVLNAHFSNRLTPNIHAGNQDIRGGWIDFENFMEESGQTMWVQIHDYRTIKSDPIMQKENADSFAAGVLRAEERCKSLSCKLPQR